MTSRYKLTDKDGFIIEYFIQVRGEIRERVQIHKDLLLQKIATCGTAIALFFSQKELQASCSSNDIQLLGFVLIPIVALLYDVMIARNINNIHRLGTFIRKELEPLVEELNLWEKYYGQKMEEPTDAGKTPKANPRNHGLPEIVLLSSFTLGTIITTLFILCENHFYFTPALIILVTLFGFTIIFMWDNILFFDDQSNQKLSSQLRQYFKKNRDLLNDRIAAIHFFKGARARPKFWIRKEGDK